MSAARVEMGTKAQAPSLSMRGMSKRFDERIILDDAHLDVAAGEVHALLGENGAGKSSLMNILAGVYASDSGEIRVNGEVRAIRNPRDAAALGVGMVHQHFRLVPTFTVLENVSLATGQGPSARIEKAMSQSIRATAETLGFAIDPGARVSTLSIAERQRAEICKVLLMGGRLLVFDEPTAVLTDREAETLLVALRKLCGLGRSVILITHKLREVVGHCDRVTVMRQGRTVAANLPGVNSNAAELARHMVGESLIGQRAPSKVTAGSNRMESRDVTVLRADGSVAVDGVTFALCANEIVGVAGVGGNGQQQLADALAGLMPLARGMIKMDGVDVSQHSVAARRDLGLRVVPSDRMSTGLIGELSVSDNLALTRVRTGSFGRAWLRHTQMKRDATNAIEGFAIAGATANRAARLLSGGNAQKLLLARELGHGGSVLIAHSPTRGLDVKACAFVHEQIRRAVRDGMACLLISEDLEEILAMSDRIFVMSRGRLQPECAAGVDAAEIGALMLA